MTIHRIKCSPVHRPVRLRTTWVHNRNSHRQAVATATMDTEVVNNRPWTVHRLAAQAVSTVPLEAVLVVQDQVPDRRRPIIHHSAVDQCQLEVLDQLHRLDTVPDHPAAIQQRQALAMAPHRTVPVAGRVTVLAVAYRVWDRRPVVPVFHRWPMDLVHRLAGHRRVWVVLLEARLNRHLWAMDLVVGRLGDKYAMLYYAIQLYFPIQ